MYIFLSFFATFGAYHKNQTMKSTKTLFDILTIITFSFAISSCSKYEDGPNFTLKSKKSRLAAEWTCTECPGVDASTTTTQFTFTKDGDFTFYFKFDNGIISNEITEDGTWEWGDDKETIEITRDGDTDTFRITRLASDELVMRDEDDEELVFEN